MPGFSKALAKDAGYLLFPVSNRPGKGSLFRVDVEGRTVAEFRAVAPAGGDPDWWAFYPLRPLEGKTVRVESPDVPDNEVAALQRITVADSIPDGRDDYSRPYRNRFHFSTRRGWTNDPNGLVYHEGLYHLYYQYNPFGIRWANMQWGHAVSRDLVHWKECEPALGCSDVNDMKFSGGAFVDERNRSGLGEGGRAPLFAVFTSTGRGECLACSVDGGYSFKELQENPVVRHQGRDPKVIWHEPTQKWVMIVYDSTSESLKPAAAAGTDKDREGDNFAFYSSRDLRHWQWESRYTHPDRSVVFECPELFELPVENQPGRSKWIVYGASNRYVVGHFDGTRFMQEQEPVDGVGGRNYAAQTFSNAGGRRIQIGWIRCEPDFDRFPCQTSTQCMTVPVELSLRRTKEGYRLLFRPVRELEALRTRRLVAEASLPVTRARRLLTASAGKLLDIEVGYEMEPGAVLELVVNGLRFRSVASSGNLRVLADRTVAEGFSDDGLHAVALNGAVPKSEQAECSVDIKGRGTITRMHVWEMGSIWTRFEAREAAGSDIGCQGR